MSVQFTPSGMARLGCSHPILIPCGCQMPVYIPPSKPQLYADMDVCELLRIVTNLNSIIREKQRSKL